MFLHYSINPLYLLIAFTTFYYAILTLSNVTSIYLLAQATTSVHSDPLFDYSENLLRFLSSAVGGICVISTPTLLVLLSKQYYYIDDYEHKHALEITYNYAVVFGLFIFSFISPYIVIGWFKTTHEFKDMISKQNAKILYYKGNGYNFLLDIEFKGFISDIMVGITCAVFDLKFQYLLPILSIQMNISRSINWKYVWLSYLLKSIVTTCTSIAITKYKPTFIFDKKSKPLLLVTFFVIAAINITSILVFEKAFISSLDDISSLRHNRSYSIDSKMLTIIILLIERLISFLIYNLYSIPSEISWNIFNELLIKNKQSQDNFLNEVAKTKVNFYYNIFLSLFITITMIIAIT